MNFLKKTYKFVMERILIVLLAFILILCGMFGPIWTIETFYELIKKNKGE